MLRAKQRQMIVVANFLAALALFVLFLDGEGVTILAGRFVGMLLGIYGGTDSC